MPKKVAEKQERKEVYLWEKKYETLDLELADEVATVCLSRPPLNLFSPKMVEELIDVWHSFRNNRKIRFVIIAAKGINFSGGADLKEFKKWIDSQEALPENARYQQLAGHEMMRSLESLEQVTVAVLQGAVIGAGMAVAMACDFRIMAKEIISRRVGNHWLSG